MLLAESDETACPADAESGMLMVTSTATLPPSRSRRRAAARKAIWTRAAASDFGRPSVTAICSLKVCWTEELKAERGMARVRAILTWNGDGAGVVEGKLETADISMAVGLAVEISEEDVNGPGDGAGVVKGKLEAAEISMAVAVGVEIMEEDVQLGPGVDEIGQAGCPTQLGLCAHPDTVTKRRALPPLQKSL
jgi:hypothetical protein